MQPADRTFHFISDPTHKENLSGRVTAACLNCRRKKIKCSGEANCRQCQEKGLVCEGPPSRKRPKRDHTTYDSQASIAEEHRFDLKHESKSPNVRGSQASALAQDDSGYSTLERSSRSSYTPSTSASPGIGYEATANEAEILTGAPRDWRPPHQFVTGRQSSETSSISFPRPQPSRLAFDTNYGRQRPSGASSGTTSSSERSLRQRGSHFITSIPGTSIPATSAYPEAFRPPASMALSASEYGGSNSRRQSPGWAFGGSGDQYESRSPTQLIQAAEALEGQAKSLRRLASEGQSNDVSSQNKVPSMLSFGHGDDHTHANMHGVSGAQSNPPYQVDDTSFFRSDGNLRSGLTPGAGDFGEWWDANAQSANAHQANYVDGVASESSDLGPGQARLQRAFYGQLAQSIETEDPNEHGGLRHDQQRQPR